MGDPNVGRDTLVGEPRSWRIDRRRRGAHWRALSVSLILGLTACAGTPDGEISEIEGAINGAVLEVWSTSAGDYVEIAVDADHDCDLYDIYFACLKPGDMLSRTDVPRYHGPGFEEESVEDGD